SSFAQSFYPNMRFGLGMALLDNGYFTHDFGDTTPATLDWWYDEYDFNLGYPLGPARKNNTETFPNIIGNSGFESGLAGWQFILAKDGRAQGTATVDTTTTANGSSNSARINVSSVATMNWHIDVEQAN